MIKLFEDDQVITHPFNSNANLVRSFLNPSVAVSNLSSCQETTTTTTMLIIEFFCTCFTSATPARLPLPSRNKSREYYFLISRIRLRFQWARGWISKALFTFLPPLLKQNKSIMLWKSWRERLVPLLSFAPFFFLFILFFQDGNRQAFFFFFLFFFIIRDSVNRRSSNETPSFTVLLSSGEKKKIAEEIPRISPLETLSSTDVFSFSFVLRIDTWNNFDMFFFSRARRSLCIDVSLRKNVSFIIIIIRGINNAKDACTNYKILVKRNLSSCIYKSPNEINFHESSKIDKYSSSSCQYIYEAESREFCEFGFVFP